MRYTLLFIILCLIVGCKNKTTHTEHINVAIGEQGTQLDSIIVPYINELRELTDNKAGLAIGVTKGEQTIFTHCFGYSNIHQQNEVDFNTVFHIASVSKPFVAFAVAKLIQQKKLKLEDKIVDIIPEFEMKSSSYGLITIKHILTHTSGIPTNISPDDWTNPSFGILALEENLKIIKKHSLEFEPGTQFNYSNSAFDILGLIISRVSNMQFSDYLASTIFVPAGMNNTTYKKNEENNHRDLAMSYSYGLETQEWQPYPYNEKLFPSSGVLTSLNDMLIWNKLNLNKGTLDGKTIIEEEYYNLIIEPHFTTPWNDKIGLSWFLQSYLEKPIIMHQGQDTGFESIVYLYPHENMSIVVMANRDFSRTARIINAISEVLFAKEPKSYEVSAKYQFAKHYNEGGIHKAKEAWLELKKDTTDIYYTDSADILSIGAILENGGKWKETKDILEYYNSINKKSTYSWRLLGNANLNLGDTLTALSNYQKCLEINPNYEKAKTAIEQIKTKHNNGN